MAKSKIMWNLGLSTRIKSWTEALVGEIKRTRRGRSALESDVLASKHLIEMIDMVYNLLSKVPVEITLSLEGTFAIGRIELEIHSYFVNIKLQEGYMEM